MSDPEADASPDPHRVDPDGLADELAEWMAHNWATETRDGDETKVPKQPTDPARNARSNDASTWGSFADALDHAVESDDLGLGFPCAQPGHPFVFIDVDIPGGDEWVPSFDRLGGAIVERSPSGSSRRIILTGCDAPEWWSNQAERTDDDETREVKIFDATGYVTLTGDAIDGHGPPLEPTHSTALDHWLREAWVTFNDADEPRPWEDTAEQGGPTGSDLGGSTGETAGRDGDEWVTADVAADALDHTDPDLPNDEWVRIGFALGDHFPTGTAERLFEQWSRGGTKWDADAERRVSSIVGEADGTVGIGTLVYYAQQGGFDASAAAREAALADGGAATEPTAESSDGTGGVDGDGDGDPGALTWEYVRSQYVDQGAKAGRFYAARALEDRTAWMHVLEEGKLWVYDGDTGRFNPWGDPRAASMLERGLGEHYSRAEKGEVIDRLRSRNQVHRSDLNGGEQPGYLLCVANGVVDLETGELLDHSPEYRFTRGVSHDYGTADADPEPVVGFLDDITERTEDRDTLIDHLAHGLMPGHPYRAFVMMYGEGANGKTQVGKLFRGFVGSENAASVELQDLTGGDDFATGALPGKMINVGDDVEVSEIRNAAALKSLTGGGIMRANEKNEKQFDFENEAAMFFSANEPPRITEEKDAISDRLYPMELPYQFKGESEYDEDDPTHKRKVTGYADRLLENDAAMRGLLELCVEHAQRLIETDGQYAMPEGPAERRLRYEAASDPIARFVLRCFERGDHEDAVLKEDAYTVYKALCEADDERKTTDDVFKSKVTQQGGLDLEKTRVRWLTPGDSREQAWRYVRFNEDAAEYMNDRLRERYFPDGEWADGPAAGAGDDESGDDDAEAQRDVYNAVPVSRAAEALTGYVSVTVEVATTRRLGDDGRGLSAAVKDTSGAINVVSWDDELADALESVEGECIALKNAEVGEYEGKRQLATVDGLTEIERIQAGVGHTEGGARDPEQAGLADAAKADGGETEIEGLQARSLETLRSRMAPKEIVPAAAIAGSIGEPADDVARALDALAEKGRVIRHDDGYSLD